MNKGASWKQAGREYSRQGWLTDQPRKCGKQFWQAPCGYKVFCAKTPKDGDGSLQAHLRIVRRHADTCPACATAAQPIGASA